MSSFAGVTFKVILEDEAFYPAPVRDSDRIPHYRASIFIPNETAYKGLQDRVTTATFKVASASLAVNATIEAGYGEGTLIVPSYMGASKSYTAILISLDARGTAWYNSGFFRATAEWVILSDISP
jgi:hypothetical protein